MMKKQYLEIILNHSISIKTKSWWALKRVNLTLNTNKSKSKWSKINLKKGASL